MNQKHEAKKHVNCLAVIRADNISKVKTTLCDMTRYAHLTFSDIARKLDPAFADDILVHVMKRPLTIPCEAASIVSLEEDPSEAIKRLKLMHSPAHVIIVSPRYDIFHEIINYVDILPEMDTIKSDIDAESIQVTA